MREELLTSQGMYQPADLELIEHLSIGLEPLTRGLKMAFFDHGSNPDLIIPVMVAGLSLSSKTTLLSQVWEEFSRNPVIQDWQRYQGNNYRYYFLDTGMVRELGNRLGIIKNRQGGLTLADYQGLSDLTEELVPIGMEYLQGPGQLGLEFVWTTAVENENGNIIGTPRGSLRLAQRLVANNNGRMIVLSTPEELKDIMGETREQARLASPQNIDKIVKSAGNIHSVQSQELVHAVYMLSSNKATRIQQAQDAALVMWITCQDQQQTFGEFEKFKVHFFGGEGLLPVLPERYQEWNDLLVRSNKKWMEQIFHKPLSKIDSTLGVVVNDPLLINENAEEEGEEAGNEEKPSLNLIPIHLYDDRLMAAGFFKALITRSEEIDSSSLRAAVKRLELEELNVYDLT